MSPVFHVLGGGEVVLGGGEGVRKGWGPPPASTLFFFPHAVPSSLECPF